MKSRWWFLCLGGVVVVAASCDSPVADDGPIPAGRIETEVDLALPMMNVDLNVVDITNDLNPANNAIGSLNPTIDCNPPCEPSTDPCMENVCTRAGVCMMRMAADATPCDDSNSCTFGDACKSGRCVGTSPKDCAPPDQCHDAQVCDPATGCPAPKPDGAPCDDGNRCTVGDKCQSGGCAGGQTMTCTALDVCHLPGSCDPQTGVCSNPAGPDGVGCDDRKPCTTADRCVGGDCQGKVTCPAADQCHDPGMCDPAGKCTSPPKPDHTPCNDISVCTNADECLGGACVGVGMISCPPPDQCHGPGMCNYDDGRCLYPALPQGTPCDDGMPCTYDDGCRMDGACAGTPIQCVSDDVAERSCNGTRTCTVTPRPGAACDDGDPCTSGDVLGGDGRCAGMHYSCEVTACLSANACDGRGGCIPTARSDGTSCDADDSKCTPADRCQGGLCVPDPKPVVCVIKDCNKSSCNPATGNCEDTPTSGGPCGVTGCYTAGTCEGGVCSGVPRDCTSFDGPCTTGVCDARTGGCVPAHRSNGTSCDPGGLCVAGAVCAFGVCELGPASSCPVPSGPCKLAGCNPDDGMCIEIDKPPGVACDPRVACVGPGQCDDRGRCQGAPAPNGAACTTAAGAIGLCAAGSCAAVYHPDAGAPPPDDAGPGGNPDAAAATKSGGGGGCGCSSGAASGTPGAPAILIAAAAVLAARLPRRRRR